MNRRVPGSLKLPGSPVAWFSSPSNPRASERENRGTSYLFGTTHPGPGYVLLPPFEYSGCTQNLPVVI
jgi:hypothetical protein